MSMYTFITENILVIQIIVMSIVGALTGEMFRASTSDITLFRFVANFMASSLMASILTLLAMEYSTKNKVVLSSLAIYSGYKGQKESSGLIKKIIDGLLNTTATIAKKPKK